MHAKIQFILLARYTNTTNKGFTGAGKYFFQVDFKTHRSDENGLVISTESDRASSVDQPAAVASVSGHSRVRKGKDLQQLMELWDPRPNHSVRAGRYHQTDQKLQSTKTNRIQTSNCMDPRRNFISATTSSSSSKAKLSFHFVDRRC